MWLLYKDMLLVMLAHAKEQEQWCVHHHLEKALQDVQHLIELEGPDSD